MVSNCLILNCGVKLWIRRTILIIICAKSNSYSPDRRLSPFLHLDSLFHLYNISVLKRIVALIAMCSAGGSAKLGREIIAVESVGRIVGRIVWKVCSENCIRKCRENCSDNCRESL